MHPEKDISDAAHLERQQSSGDDKSAAQRRASQASDIMNTEAPVWELRKTYTKSGIAGLVSSRYVFLCALFATLGGMLFGYDQGVVSITLVMPQFLEQFPEVSEQAAGAGFKKGLMTAILELGAFLGKSAKPLDKLLRDAADSRPQAL